MANGLKAQLNLAQGNALGIIIAINIHPETKYF